MVLLPGCLSRPAYTDGETLPGQGGKVKIGLHDGARIALIRKQKNTGIFLKQVRLSK
jgi:hypothetical protein